MYVSTALKEGMSTDQEKYDRRDKDGGEPAKVGIRNEGTKEREKGWDSSPCIHILGRSCRRLLQDGGQIHHQISAQPHDGEPLC